MLNSLSFKQKIILLMVPIGLLLAFSIYNTGSRVGKTRVEVTALPKDSKVTIDGKPVSNGTNYLKPGKHTFSAAREGFETHTRTMSIGEEKAEVGLTPTPKSEEAIKLLSQNPKLQQEREALGGIIANQEGLIFKEQTPILEYLPVTEIRGPFSINYGVNNSRENGAFLEISDSSPNGRIEALKWIKEHGEDPTNLEIRYKDFNNPLISASGSGGSL